MPAINPARLKQQAVLVAEEFDQPASFTRSLHHLLEFYADRSQRPGQAGAPRPLLEAYHIRPPVLRQLLLELNPLANAFPDQAFDLCDALWKEPYLEFHQLAAALLGQIPVRSPDPVLNRIELWARSESEMSMISALLRQGLDRMRKEDPEEVLRLAQRWIADQDTFIKGLGLRVMIPLVEDPLYQNLPVFFDLITPLCREIPSRLRPDLLEVLSALAHRSPSETAFFLQQQLLGPSSPDTPWLIRQSLREFPPEVQDRLRQSLRSLDQSGHRPIQ